MRVKLKSFTQKKEELEPEEVIGSNSSSEDDTDSEDNEEKTYEVRLSTVEATTPKVIEGSLMQDKRSCMV